MSLKRNVTNATINVIIINNKTGNREMVIHTLIQRTCIVHKLCNGNKL